jgi:Spy/CpxP family protein refolding chaperone
MTFRGTTRFALIAMIAISLTGLTAYAQQPHTANPAGDLNLTNAQVFKIQALMMSQTAKLRALAQDVESAKNALSAAIEKGDPALTTMAVLSLDAAEKALKNTELAGQQSLLSLLSDSQKQIVKDASIKQAPLAD